jgi:hypothetical protein
MFICIFSICVPWGIILSGCISHKNLSEWGFWRAQRCRAGLYSLRSPSPDD